MNEAADDMRGRLLASIESHWTSPRDKKTARVTVDDVLSALRHNPSWCKPLGIGDDRG